MMPRLSLLYLAFNLWVLHICTAESHLDSQPQASGDEAACGDVLDRKGCYSLWEYINCDERAWHIRNFFTEGGITAAATFILPTLGAFGRLLTKPPFSEMPEIQTLLAFGSNLTSAQAAMYFSGMIPGVWTLDDLLSTKSVVSALGLLLNDTERCNINFGTNANGQVHVYGGYGNNTWDAVVVDTVQLCMGHLMVVVDEACCTEWLSAEVQNTALYEELGGTDVHDQPVFNGVQRGGCYTPYPELVATLMALSPDNLGLRQWYLRSRWASLKESGNDDEAARTAAAGLTNASIDVSVTLFVPRSNSLSCLTRPGYDIPEGNVTRSYNSTADSVGGCCFKCMASQGCNAYSFKDEGGTCTLKTVKEGSVPQPRSGTTLGFPGVFDSDYDDRYVLYHTLPGSYCPDALVAAGSINTILGTATRQHRPLTFSRNNAGQVTVTAPSLSLDGHGVRDIANRTVTILDHYTSCRSVFYIIDDEFFPPESSSTSTSPVVSHQEGGMWAFLSAATRQNHELVWEEDCWNPLPNLSSLVGAQKETPQDGAPFSATSGSTHDLTDDLMPQHALNATYSDSGHGLSPGAIAAVAVGSLAATGLTLGLAALAARRKLRSCRPQPDSPRTAASRKVKHETEVAGRDATGSSSRSDSVRGTATDEMGTWLENSATAVRGGSLSDQSLGEASRVLAVKDYFDTMPQDWVLKDVKTIKQIGSGSFGIVYVGEWQESVVAVKCFRGDEVVGGGDGEDMWMDELLAMHKEVSIMSGLRHPNVVQFLGVTYEPPAVVMEYCHLHSLFRVLRKASKDPAFLSQLTWKRRVNMAYDAAKGMLFLHSREVPIIHRDLKSANLLVDKSWTVKVSDFGLSKIVGLAATKLSISAQNPRWMAPELIDAQGESGQATIASDVYAFGIIMWELLTLQEPFQGDPAMRIMYWVVHNGLRPDIPPREECSASLGYEQYINLMQRCWAQAPAQRPTFKTIAEEIRYIRSMLLYSYK